MTEVFQCHSHAIRTLQCTCNIPGPYGLCYCWTPLGPQYCLPQQWHCVRVVLCGASDEFATGTGLNLKLSKCSSFQPKVQLISREGVWTDPANAERVARGPHPAQQERSNNSLVLPVITAIWSKFHRNSKAIISPRGGWGHLPVDEWARKHYWEVMSSAHYHPITSVPWLQPKVHSGYRCQWSGYLSSPVTNWIGRAGEGCCLCQPGTE